MWEAQVIIICESKLEDIGLNLGNSFMRQYLRLDQSKLETLTRFWWFYRGNQIYHFIFRYVPGHCRYWNVFEQAKRRCIKMFHLHVRNNDCNSNVIRSKLKITRKTANNLHGVWFLWAIAIKSVWFRGVCIDRYHNKEKHSDIRWQL